MVGLAKELGKIYWLRFPGQSVVIVLTHALVNKTCNKKCFKKLVNSVLVHVRDGVHNGLFTAKMGKVNWEIAHHVLMPAFGPLSIHGMFNKMHDIASQLALKWARYGPDEPIMVTNDFTRYYSPQVLKARKAGKSNYNNLLDAMLRGIDLKTGLKMTNKSIMDNLITFLIAGHETMSGLLLFAQQEVDEVVGQGVIKVAHLLKLPYINSILHKTLCLNMMILLFTIKAFKDTVLAGKYPVKAGETIVNLLAKSHLDPEIYGDNAREFKPERMADDNFKFLLDPNYKLEYKQTLTIKPKDLYMKARLRHAGLAAAATAQDNVLLTMDGQSSTGVPLTILYGLNSGTCKTLARRLAADASGKGFQIVQFNGLDSGKAALPKNQPVVIVTSSYKGQPPDNTKQFVSWLENLDLSETPLKDALTFHQIPRLVNDRLEKLGGQHITKLGLANASSDEMFSMFETWADNSLWPRLVAQYAGSEEAQRKSSLSSTAAGIDVTVSNSRTQALRQDVGEAMVVDTRLLTSEAKIERRKKHLEIRLLEGMTYTTETVRRAMRHFKLAWDVQIKIAASGPTTALPTNGPVAANDILSTYIELLQPATRKDLQTMADLSKDAETKATLQKLASETYIDEILNKGVLALDILEQYPGIDLPLGSFLLMLPLMRMHQYSISSLPLVNSNHATISILVLDSPSRSRADGPRHLGVATSYLDSLQKGNILQVTVRKSAAGFSMPDDVENTPMICIAAGMGIAPFCGFLQEREALKEQGKNLAPAILFFGCREPGRDDLYREQLDTWAEQGIVNQSKGCAHVNDRIWHDRRDVVQMWKEGAKVFVCGSRGVADLVKGAILDIFRDEMARREREGEEVDGGGLGVDSAEKWMEAQRNVRYVMDVFD
ncbi:cytochrome P450 [Aspergillus stella-maris]|uniref:cytochrome P450 n=1 Tax=Aspergillus stella-maris TaxID=1810926 RepID=UPI003CCCDCCA